MRGAVLISGGTIVDAHGTRRGEVAIVDGIIVEPDVLPTTSVRVVDAEGCVVSTGLVDLHAHLGEPGDEAAETIESAGRSAVLGGFTTVLAMPDTDPCIDSAAVVDHVRMLGKQALCNIEVAGAVTVGRRGDQLVPMAELAEAGVRFLTDCGAGVQDPMLLRRALEYARPLDVTIAQPAKSLELSRGAQMHEGEWSSRLGLEGEPAEAEEIMVMRDVALARLTGARLHFQTLSTAGSFAVVGAAGRSGVAVSCEIAAHHLCLSDADLEHYDTNCKVEPPLRDATDVQAARTALASNSIDSVVSDHTPHPVDRKERPFDEAEPGSTGLEIALPAALATGAPLDAVLRSMSWRPAELLGLGEPVARALLPGHPADVVVIDPAEQFVVDPSEHASLAANCAFAGTAMQGRVRATVVAGSVVVEAGEIAA